MPLENGAEVHFQATQVIEVDDVADVMDKLQPDWQMVPDGDGLMHLVDINENMPAPLFNAWTDVAIRLVTRTNQNQPPLHIFLNNAAQLRNSPFNRNHPTRIVIHGWLNHADSRINHMLSNAYLARGNFNVFIVDWSAGASILNYVIARSRIFDVGHYVAQFIDFLRREENIDFSSITIIGHSLGAHTAGIVGKRVSGGRIGNIVAIDPAFSMFSINNPAERIAYTDAVYVEGLHTDAGRLGFNEPLGDATFYPNFGIQQPGCGIDATGTCGHNLAVDFFAESLLPINRFWGTRCASFTSIWTRICPPAGPSQQMGGEPLTRAANGVYFFPTNFFPPYAQGFRN